ncbi:hypothetical protein PoB_001937400 [Plakobranchus ocellatus]|uniref:Uncharacterized protein n=1 Tax=Plakobranchus ocellatus TaxID=259542 RepID=A0AAV3ZER6_9GAST|nr:hypothetical protein PoB_001937400 [Plakobranchus ocellatus]
MKVVKTWCRRWPWRLGQPESVTMVRSGTEVTMEEVKTHCKCSRLGQSENMTVVESGTEIIMIMKVVKTRCRIRRLDHSENVILIGSSLRKVERSSID